jgi:hypothetical protein
VPPLSFLLKEKLSEYGEDKKVEDDLPMILYYHTHTKKIYTFPKTLSDQFAWSSALVDAWATMVMFEADGPYMEKFITDYIESQTKDLPEDDP